MLALIRGQKFKLVDVTPSPHVLLIEISYQAPFVLDMAVFGLDGQYSLSDERYMTFYNQPHTPCQAIRLMKNDEHYCQFYVDLSRLPATIEHLVLTAAIDGAAVMAQLRSLSINICNMQQQVLAQLILDGTQFAKEKAIMLLELYRKQDIWRCAAVGQGFNDGLAALIEHFGGEVATHHAPITPPTSTVSLQKISLNKVGEKHRLSLDKAGLPTLTIEALWVDNGDGYDDNDDLDLRVGMLIEGEKNMHYIHAPDKIGSLNHFPYVYHTGDVREASVHQPAKETVQVHAEISKYIGKKVALVFSVYSAVGNGMVSIASLRPKMRMQYGEQIVECEFNPEVSAQAKRRDVYTYVIGLAIIDQNSIELRYSGATSQAGSEATPRLTWQQHDVALTMDGRAFFKGF